MRLFLASLALAVSAPAFAQVNVPPPAFLRDGSIEVHLKSGTVDKFSTNDYKVVTRASSKKVQKELDDLRKQVADLQTELAAEKAKVTALQSHPAAVKEVPKEIVREIPPPPDKKNLIYGGLGVGPDGVGVKQTSQGQDVSPRTAALLDVGYLRKLGDYAPNTSLGVSGFMGTSTQSRSYGGFVNVGYAW